MNSIIIINPGITGSKSIGPAKMLTVKAGDRVNMEVFSGALRLCRAAL